MNIFQQYVYSVVVRIPAKFTTFVTEETSCQKISWSEWIILENQRLFVTVMPVEYTNSKLELCMVDVGIIHTTLEEGVGPSLD